MEFSRWCHCAGKCCRPGEIYALFLLFCLVFVSFFVVVQVKSLPFVFIYFCCRPDEIFFCFLFDDDDKNMIQIDNSGLDNNNDDDWLNGDNGVLNDNDHTMIRI